MCPQTVQFGMQNTRRSMSNTVLLQKQERCKHSKKWEFEVVEEKIINYRGKKDDDNDLDEDEKPKKKSAHSVPRQIRKLVEKDRECKHAHNAIELELVPLKSKKHDDGRVQTGKIDNLKGVLASQSRSLNQNHMSVDWKPGNKHVKYDISVFQPYIDTKKAEQRENEDDAEKPKSIFDREDLHKDPLDEKD